MHLFRVALLFSSSLAVSIPAQEFADFRKWAEYLRPTAEDHEWAKLPWLQSFGDGMRIARERRQPLLLWAMNGHPLGCT